MGLFVYTFIFTYLHFYLCFSELKKYSLKNAYVLSNYSSSCLLSLTCVIAGLKVKISSFLQERNEKANFCKKFVSPYLTVIIIHNGNIYSWDSLLHDDINDGLEDWENGRENVGIIAVCYNEADDCDCWRHEITLVNDLQCTYINTYIHNI